MYVAPGTEGPYNHAKSQRFFHSKSCVGKFKFYLWNHYPDYKHCHVTIWKTLVSNKEKLWLFLISWPLNASST